jgi:hypothetical protein
VASALPVASGDQTELALEVAYDTPTSDQFFSLAPGKYKKIRILVTNQCAGCDGNVTLNIDTFLSSVGGGNTPITLESFSFPFNQSTSVVIELPPPAVQLHLNFSGAAPVGFQMSGTVAVWGRTN